MSEKKQPSPDHRNRFPVNCVINFEPLKKNRTDLTEINIYQISQSFVF